MKVMYVSAYPYPLPMVKYWKSDEPEAFARIEIGISETYNQMQMCEEPANILAQNLFRNPGFTHTIEMIDLEPDTKYFYKVGNGEIGQSDVFSFQSAPNYPRDIRFVAFGDQDISQAAHNTSF